MAQSPASHEELRASIDPLSQLLGAQTAQVAALAQTVTELRADVLQNRIESQRRHDEISRSLEDVRMEYRTVKHDYRNQEMAAEAVKRQLESINDRITSSTNHNEVRFRDVEARIDTKHNDTSSRLDLVEITLAGWKGRFAVVVSLVIFFGGLLSTLVQPLVTHIWRVLLGITS